MSRRPPLSDETLAAQLHRRADQHPLLSSEREDLVQSIVAGTTALAVRRGRWSLPRRMLAPALAGGVLVVAMLVVAMLVVRPPAPPPGGGQRPHVLSPAELAELRQGEATGIVVADLSAAHVGPSLTDCYGRTPCWLVVLSGTAPIIDFSILGPDEPPDLRQPTALALLLGAIEYLGPVATPGGELAWSVGDLTHLAEPPEELHVVHGWLAESLPHSCPAPPDLYDATPAPGDVSPPTPATEDFNFWCPASWLTEEREILGSVGADGRIVGMTQPSVPHIQVQTGAYGEFADPQAVPYGAAAPTPAQGSYLVHPAGCPVAVFGGRCPVWTVVGRLADLQPDGTPTTPPPVPPSPTAAGAPGLTPRP